MKRIASLTLTVIFILQVFSYSAYCLKVDYTLDNEVGFYPDRVSVSVNQEYTFDLHVFTAEDFPGINIEEIEQKPTGLIRNEDGTIGVDPAFDIDESDIEYVRTNLIIHLKDTDNENIGQSMNELLAFSFVDSVNRIYIREQEDGHEHMPSEPIFAYSVLDLENDSAVSEYFTYCLLCGKEIGRERITDYSCLDFSKIIISDKNPNVNKVNAYSVEDFPGIDINEIYNGYVQSVLYLNTDTREEGIETINKIRQLDFVGSAYFNSHAKAETFPLPGDVNIDNKVDVSDARETLRRSIGLAAKCYNQNADIDNDGKITVADARLVLRTAIGLVAE